MNIYFYLWLAMTICAVILVYLNRQKNAIINQKDAIIKGYEEGLEKDRGNMSELVDDYKKMLEKQRKENKVLRKYAADYTPMKSMADYTEKIQKFSEQAEDMFGLYIDTIRLERGNSMFCRYWKVDMKTSGCNKPKDDIEKQSADY